MLALIDLIAFAVVFAATLLGCILSPAVRSHDKRAYLYAVNAFSALTLAIFLIKFNLSQSVAAAAALWCVGYLTYGLLCLFKVRRASHAETPAVQRESTVSAMPVRQPRPAPSAPAAVAPQPAAVPSGVRLDHALSIADKLLMKNLGRGDRQELEKIKTSLTVLKVKGILSAQEGEALNEMFNALLKFMAKYDL